MRTCVAAQQRLVSEVANEVLKACKLVKPKHVAVVLAGHVEMLHRILRPACQTSSDGFRRVHVEQLQCCFKRRHS